MAKGLLPTMPHRPAAEDPNWYRPTIIGATGLAAAAALVVYNVQPVTNGRLLGFIGVMWLTTLVGAAALRNRAAAAMMAARRAGAGASRDDASGAGAARSAEPDW